MRFFVLFFILFSVWPWEVDQDQTKKTSFDISPAVIAPARTLRVALFYELPAVKISTSSSYQIKELATERPLHEGTFLPVSIFRAEPSGIRIGGAIQPVSGLRVISDTKEVNVQGKNYHNVIQILKNPKGTLTVVNEIDVEDYLKGVLPSEMHSTWPQEALKAQAVISRTYAIFKNIENKKFPFTLSSDVESQVYGGKKVEQPAANKAVEKTRGEILTYHGKIFPTFFHAACGGRTTRSDFQWNIEPHPSLKGVECNYCQGFKFDHWKVEFTGREIRRLLGKKGFSVPDVSSLSLEDIDVSGRPRSVFVHYPGGSLKVPAHKFRLALGAEKLRSIKMQIYQSGNQFVMEGRGWGHGVGLCQWGAKRLAELGYKYQDILHFYYPESEITHLDDLVSRQIGQYVETGSKEGNVLKRWFNSVQSYVEDL